MTLVSTAAKSAASSGGSQTQLASTTLLAPGTVDFNGISQSYTDLLVSIIARGARAAAAEFLGCQFNADSGTNYDTEQAQAAGATFTASNLAAQTKGRISQNMPAASASAGFFYMARVWIPGYASTTWRKLAFCEGFVNNGGSWVRDFHSFEWASTAAISRITLFGETTANLDTGTFVRLYGVS